MKNKTSFNSALFIFLMIKRQKDNRKETVANGVSVVVIIIIII